MSLDDLIERVPEGQRADVEEMVRKLIGMFAVPERARRPRMRPRPPVAMPEGVTEAEKARVRRALSGK